MSERNVFPEPATTKGGGAMPPGHGGEGHNASPGAGRRRLALWLVASLVLAAASVYGLFLDRSLRSDPFARSLSLGDWLLHPQPHPALARIPVVPIGANGTLTFRPAETGWINTPYLPGSKAAATTGDAPRAPAPVTMGLISTAYAADAPQPKAPTKLAPPNAPVLDPDLLKKSVSQRVAKEPPTYNAPAQQTAEQATQPPVQAQEPAPELAIVDTPDGPPRILHAQFLPDGRRGWVAGEAPGILATEDGGETWRNLGATSLGRVRAFSIDAAGNAAWAFTTVGLLTTKDGGKGWTPTFPNLEWSNSGMVWSFNDGYWTGIGSLYLRVTPATTGTAAPIPVAGGDLFTTATGEVFEVPNARDNDAAAVAAQATTQARQMGTEPGRFHAVFFQSDEGGTTAWAAGDGGTLVRLTGTPEDRSNAGDAWSSRETPTKANLRSLYFQADGRIGWASSGWNDGNEEADRPVVLQTIDGGATWQRLPYRHLPAPWVFLALPAFVLTGYRTVTAGLDLRAAPPRRASVADEAASDAPIGWEDKDALGLQAIARALSKFVRNRNTKPPLTFAVSGPWGTGKSSLMNLVAEDLRTFGTRPVWFNAWHHQKEEHLLAALLEAIRSQAIPTWWRWSGLTFRLRLLWRRVRNDLQSALAVGFLVVVAVVAFQLVLEMEEVQRLLAALDDSTFGEWLTGALLGQLTALGTFGAGLYAVALALLKLRVITLNPAQLMASLRERARPSDLRDQLGFRHRFDGEFNSVCHALRTHHTAGMVIMIDDLDRCQPDNVLDILEAVNFLATAGPCFIFLGIDTEKVTSSVAHGFKDSILVLPNSHTQAGAEHALKPDAVALATFARAYLEKLINITVPVPTATDRTSAVLLDVAWQDDAAAGQEEASGAVDRPQTAGTKGDTAPLSPWPARVRRMVHDAYDIGTGLAALALVICLAAGGMVQVVGEQWPVIPAETTAHAAPATAAAQPAARPGAATAAPGGQAAELPGEGATLAAAAAPTVTAAEITAHPLLPYAPFLLPAMALVLVGFWVAGRLLAVREAVVEDSADFREALRIFNKAIFAASPTPRGVKRFENRLRYFAMRSRGDDRPPDWIDRLFGRLGHRVRTEEGQPEEVDIPEPTLVALGAIAGVDAEILKQASRDGDHGVDEVIGLSLSTCEHECDTHADEADPDTLRSRQRYDLVEEIHAALGAFEKTFDGYWPPTPDQIRVFCDLSGTIRD